MPDGLTSGGNENPAMLKAREYLLKKHNVTESEPGSGTIIDIYDNVYLVRHIVSDEDDNDTVCYYTLANNEDVGHIGDQVEYEGWDHFYIVNLKTQPGTIQCRG
jgi:hypothetical protein